MASDTGTPRRCDTAAASGCVQDCPACLRLRAALRATLVNRSWHDLTPSAVADTAGMAVSAFFAHYPSVAACGAAALDEAADECRAACELAYPAWRDCHERFLRMSDAAVSWMAARPEMARLLFVIPRQAYDPVLLAKVSAFKRALVSLFEQPGRCSPAGRTHVEFVIGLFFQVVVREFARGAEIDTLRLRVLTLAPFVETPTSDS